MEVFVACPTMYWCASVHLCAGYCVESLQSLSVLQLLVVLQHRCSPSVLCCEQSRPVAKPFCLGCYSATACMDMLMKTCVIYGRCAMAGVCILVVGCTRSSCLLHKRSVLHLSRLFVFVPVRYTCM